MNPAAQRLLKDNPFLKQLDQQMSTQPDIATRLYDQLAASEWEGPSRLAQAAAAMQLEPCPCAGAAENLLLRAGCKRVGGAAGA